MIICLLKINWFASFKNIRISLFILYWDFQIHFSIDFAILLKLPFCIENQYKFFYWKSIDFCQQHFLPKIYTKFSIGFTVHFELAILYWKPIQMFPLKINWFLSASFSYWKSKQNFPLHYILTKLQKPPFIGDFIFNYSKISKKYTLQNWYY